MIVKLRLLYIVLPWRVFEVVELPITENWDLNGLPTGKWVSTYFAKKPVKKSERKIKP